MDQNQIDEKSDVIANVCQLVSAGKIANAQELISSRYPMTLPVKSVRQSSRKRSTSIFDRDGFIDRYMGTRLVFPGALRVLSIMQPDLLPYHKNWQLDETHPSYWELFPTLDHNTGV